MLYLHDISKVYYRIGLHHSDCNLSIVDVVNEEELDVYHIWDHLELQIEADTINMKRKCIFFVEYPSRLTAQFGTNDAGIDI